jgi:starch phosphorylase
MKVLVNGGLNLSELDGWWAEAYRPEVGWAVGDGREHADTAALDRAEAEQLYRLLENEVIPCFYRRDEHGIPRQWIGYMRESMAGLTTRYSSNRMLREYVETYYLPLAEARAGRGADAAAALEDWYRQLSAHWQHLRFGSVVRRPVEAGYQFEVQVYLDELSADAVRVELYADPVAGEDVFRQPLARGELLAGASNAYVYRGTVGSGRPITDYTPRIVPAHESASVPLEAGFILWHQ